MRFIGDISGWKKYLSSEIYDLDSCIRHPNQRYDNMALYVSDIVGLQTDDLLNVSSIAAITCIYKSCAWKLIRLNGFVLEFQDWFSLLQD